MRDDRAGHAPLVAGERWTTPQRRLLAMLADEACRRESPTAICRRAGYAGTAAWSKAMRDPRFVAAVEALGVVVREKHGRTNRVVALLPPDGWSAPERRLLDALRREPGRPLSVRALCALAGLKGSRPWYQALKNPRFVEEAGALGMPVQIVETWRRRQAAEWSVPEQRLLAVLRCLASREIGHRWRLDLPIEPADARVMCPA